MYWWELFFKCTNFTVFQNSKNKFVVWFLVIFSRLYIFYDFLNIFPNILLHKLYIIFNKWEFLFFYNFQTAGILKRLQGKREKVLMLFSAFSKRLPFWNGHKYRKMCFEDKFQSTFDWGVVGLKSRKLELSLFWFFCNCQVAAILKWNKSRHFEKKVGGHA